MTNFELQAKEFVESKNDVKKRLTLVTSYRESIEVVHTADYASFLRHIFPVFVSALMDEPPQFVEGDEQKIRNLLLEILNRLPNNETLKEYVPHMLHLVMYLLNNDNEENAIICLRIIFDLHKNFSPLLSTMYKHLPETVKKSFSSANNKNSNTIISSIESFKVLTECPLIVMLLFQLYSDYVESNIPILIPWMMNALTLPLPQQTDDNKIILSNYIAAQVKTLSFLTYVLRGFSERMQSYVEEIASCVVNLLRKCPMESVTSRKELLVATRHILATDFRRGFYSKINMMLDENILIGNPFYSESVRPLAYMTLADLVHHMRKELNLPQLSKVVYIFSRNFQDPTLPLQVQTASVRLVLYLVDHIYKSSTVGNSEHSQQLLHRILSTVITKFTTLKDFIPNLMNVLAEKKQKRKLAEKTNKKEVNNHWKKDTWIKHHTLLQQHKYPEDTVKDVVLLLNTMIFGLKTVVWCINNPHKPSEPSNPSFNNFKNEKDISYYEEQCALLSQFLKLGLECFQIYSLPSHLTATTTASGPTDQKDILEHFAGVFTVLDSRSFKNVFSNNIDFFISQLVKHDFFPMLLIPQSFLGDQNTTNTFADILLSHLTLPESMHALGNGNTIYSSALLSLFRIIFGSLTIFPQNEVVVRYYLNKIVTQAIKQAKKASSPMNYFQMLRILFRSIGGGKFELLYKEFLPMLDELLTNLTKIQKSNIRRSIREISVELCLTIPARLSSLLQFIPILLRCVCLALTARDEGVTKLGLRTLEFWIDNLNPDYLYPHMTVVLSELMLSLCKLLKPHPSPFGTTALQILGKLGGRNRLFLIKDASLNFKPQLEDGITINIRFSPHYKVNLPLDQCIDVIFELLFQSKTTDHSKKQAYLFLKSCLITMLNPTCIEPNRAAVDIYENSIKPQQSEISNPTCPSKNDDELGAVRSRLQRQAEEHILCKLLTACMMATADPSISPISYTRFHSNDNQKQNKNIPTNNSYFSKEEWINRKKFFESICRHFSIIFTCYQERTPTKRIEELDPNVFLDAIVNVMCHNQRIFSVTGENSLRNFLDFFLFLVPTANYTTNPTLNMLLNRFIHCCHIDNWSHVHTGIAGIHALCARLPHSWIYEYQVDLIRALMICFQDDRAPRTYLMASNTLNYIIRCCIGIYTPKLDLSIAPTKDFNDQFGFGFGHEDQKEPPPDQPTISVPNNQIVFNSQPMSEADKKNHIKSLVAILAPELISIIPSIRNQSQKLFKYLSTLTGEPIASILEAYRERLMAPVLQQTLISVPPSIRIGYISAAAFCLYLQSPPFETNSTLIKLLYDTLDDLQIVTIDFEQKYLIKNSNTQDFNLNTRTSLSIHPKNALSSIQQHSFSISIETIRRIEIIKLLEAALYSQEIQQQEPVFQQLLSSIVQTFLNILTNDNIELASAAKVALKNIIERFHNLSPTLINNSIDIYLKTINYFEHLSIPFLEGFYRLVELLPTCFNDSVSKKILSHLHSFTDDESINKLKSDNAFSTYKQPIQIICLLLSIFHILPKNNDIEMYESLFNAIIRLEHSIYVLTFFGSFGYHSCPLKNSLLQILNTQPSKTISYFFSKLPNRIFTRFFYSLLQYPESQPLKEELRNRPNEILQYTFHFSYDNNSNLTNQNVDLLQLNASYSNLSKYQNLFALELQILGLQLIHLLSTDKPEWLGDISCINIAETLIAYWDDQNYINRKLKEENLPLWLVSETEILTKCLITLAQHCSDKLVTTLYNTKYILIPVAIFTRLLDLYIHRSLINTSFVTSWLTEEVPSLYSISQTQKLLDSLSDAFRNADEPHKVLIIRLIIIPIFINSFLNETGSEIISENFIRFIIQFMPADDNSANYGEEMRIELLRIATLLIEHISTNIVSYRKDFIKFAWNHLKSDHSTSKYWAYVNVCRFIDVYDTPDKIVLQVYVALLRTHQPEAKQLVVQALDILSPALPRRLPTGEHRYPTWIKWTKKIIAEEGHLVPQLIHIWSLIIRHPILFFNSRAQFVPQMVNSLNRLGLPPGRPLEARKLALDLAELIIRWDQQCLDSLQSSNQNSLLEQTMDQPLEDTSNIDVKNNTDQNDKKPQINGRKTKKRSESQNEENNNEHMRKKSKISKSNTNDDFLCTSLMVEMILTFLARLCLMTCELSDTRFLSDRCLTLIKEGLKTWKDGFVMFTNLEKILQPILHPHIQKNNIDSQYNKDKQDSRREKERTVLLARTLDLMNIFVTHQKPHYTSSNIDGISRLAVICFSSNSDTIRNGLCNMISKIFELFPLLQQYPEQPAIENFFQSIKDTILAGLASHEKNTVHTTIALLEVVCKSDNMYLENLGIESLGSLVRIINQLSREHMHLQVQPNLNTNQLNSEEKNRLRINQGLVTVSLIKALRLASSRVHLLGEYKRIYFQSLLLLLDKSNNLDVLIEITEKTCSWIIDHSHSPGLSHKEKIYFISKMTRFEHFSDESPEKPVILLKNFLQTILHLFSRSTSSKQRPDFYHRLQRVFMIGLRTRDVSIRSQYISIFHSQIPIDLNARISNIFNGQDWESLSDGFWLVQALDTILAVAMDDEALHLKENSAFVPAITVFEDQEKKINDEVSTKNIPPFLLESIKDHYDILQQFSHIQVRELTQPLRELIHSSNILTYNLWIKLFPIFWSQLDIQTKNNLNKPISNLLSQPWLKNYDQKIVPNVIQGFLEGFRLCKDPPIIPAPLLKYLGESFNCRYTSALILEDRVINLDKIPKDLNHHPIKTETSITPKVFPDDFHALSRLYNILNEKDMYIGLWSHRVKTQYSKAALALEQFGLWSRAQDMFFKALDSLHSLAQKAANSSTPGEIPHPALLQSCREMNLEPSEYIMWEQEWISCAQHLNQWDILYDFSRGIRLPKLQMECTWKLPDWPALKELLYNYQFGDSIEKKIYSIYTSIHDRRLQDREIHQLCDQAVQLALREWNNLPHFVSFSHIPLLQNFQRLVELQESAQILLEITSCSRHQQIPDLKTFTTTWRERLPNKWEEIPVWADVLTWRNHMFSMITNTFNLPDNNIVLGCLHDTPWTVIKFAQIARKQQLSTVCLTSLAKLYAFSTMDARDAFMKLREQIKICLQSSTEIRAALNIINSTNLDYFNHSQKAELFRLKGEALQSLGYGDESNTAFSTALSVQDTLGKGWLSWAIFCDRVFTVKKDLQWAEFAVCCYLQGVAHRSNRARFMLARVLWLLSYDKEGGAVNRAFERYSNLPPWVWLLWIPQLLTSLARFEGSAMKAILIKIACNYPQAMYFSIRSFLIEKREMRALEDQQRALHTQVSNTNTTQPTENIPQLQPIAPAPTNNNFISNNNQYSAIRQQYNTAHTDTTQNSRQNDKMDVENNNNNRHSIQTSHQSVEDIVVALRNYHPSLVTEVERMLDEIAKRFKPEPDEELLGAVVALFLKCFRQPISINNDEVPSNLSTTIERVYTKFFSPDPQLTNKRHLLFVQRYRESFRRDFLNSPPSMVELVNRLKRWKYHLELQVGQRELCEIKLEKLSPYLVRFQSFNIEIPGQYIKDEEPGTGQVILERFEPDVQIMHNHGFSFRRINLRGSDGKVRSFLVQYHISHITRSDERIMQLFVILNRLMTKYKETRKRELVFHVPIVVPLTQRQRLMQCHPSFITLEEVFENYCTTEGIDADKPLLDFRQQYRFGLSQVQQGKFSIEEMRTKIYHSISDTTVSDKILTTFLHRTFPLIDEFWYFRRELAAQLALSAFLSYSLSIGDRCLHKISFSRKTARIMNSEFYANYNEKFALECLEPIPFRLTRNFRTLFTPFLLDGVFTSALTAAAACLARNQEILKNYLCLYLRDDLLSWNQAKTNKMNDEEQRSLEMNQRDKLSNNVRHIIKRIHSMMPSPTPGKDPDTHAVNSQVIQLMDMANDPSKLSQMTPTWFPWF